MRQADKVEPSNEMNTIASPPKLEVVVELTEVELAFKVTSGSVKKGQGITINLRWVECRSGSTTSEVVSLISLLNRS